VSDRNATKLAKELFGRKATRDVSNVIRAAERRRAALVARDSLIDFTKFTMPSPEDPDDASLSRFEPALHHYLIAKKLEDVERGKCKRLIITMPPRHGKSELASRRFSAWYMGRHPEHEVIFATYNQTFAEDFGGEIRDIMNSPQYGLVFPDAKLKRDSQARDKLSMAEINGIKSGALYFAGADGSVTGRGANLFVIDDPFKNREQAESESSRRKVWDFFTSVAYTRLMPNAVIVIILTRWHEDDIVGRLFDPLFVTDQNIAKEFEVLSLPAIAEDNDPMGRKRGEALWPERYPVDVLNTTRVVLGARDWASLYQQRPTPDDGAFFTRDMFKPYERDELPDDFRGMFRVYGASDHAVGQKQTNDKSVIGCVGFDQRGDIWVLPDVVWDRLTGEAQVDAMIRQMQTHRPTTWWAEKGHISSSIGPYLRRQMFEKKVPTWLQEKTPSVDKVRRAQSIRARAALRPIRVPAFMAWWGDALAELLAFPNARHDDFVDWLAWIGLGLETERGAEPIDNTVREVGPPLGSGAWVVWRSKKDKQLQAGRNKRRGW
jgi:predicted phage terminase large subunit-like protein